ncbi:hypothetical protein RN001_011654 [Aquatica leii]|uniref:Protein sleepless n=1 Tax=Aquatica leii TaxID=1421715 RepID=A0AAN7P2P5_9COLE|nr:hypothetical protein RN001_011654 [Aquatica leii]
MSCTIIQWFLCLVFVTFAQTSSPNISCYQCIKHIDEECSKEDLKPCPAFSDRCVTHISKTADLGFTIKRECGLGPCGFDDLMTNKGLGMDTCDQSNDEYFCLFCCQENGCNHNSAVLQEFKAALPTEQLLIDDDQDQPSTSTGVKARQCSKTGRPDLKTLQRKGKRRDTDSSSEEENDRFSLQDSEDLETFSDLENPLTPSIPDVQTSDFLQHLKVDDFVLVRYECELYPGRIVHLEDDGEVSISAMKKSASNWK